MAAEEPNPDFLWMVLYYPRSNWFSRKKRRGTCI